MKLIFQILSVVIYGGVDQYFTEPTYERPLHIKFSDMSEHFHETIIENFLGLLMIFGVTGTNAHLHRIIMPIQCFLTGTVVSFATFDQFQKILWVSRGQDIWVFKL